MSPTRTAAAALPSVSSAPRVCDEAAALCPEAFLPLLLRLHEEFEPRRRDLLARRREVLAAAHAGELPELLRASPEWREERIEIPSFAVDQRNQMTGPADNAKLVINLCNSGAPGCMLDLEDAVTTGWRSISEGIRNILGAVHGTLTWEDPTSGRRYAVEASEQVVYARPRGMHLDEPRVVEGLTLSGGLFDLARTLFGVRGAPERRRCLYVPKVESAAEGEWWVDLVRAVEGAVGLPAGSTKIMFLIESFPAAFQIERLIEHTRSHVIGLNLGRWDYMASLIQYKLADPGWILPDRNTIPLDVPFFRSVRRLIVELANRHGIVPIGGMTALFPSKDPAQNEIAMRVLTEDKRLEAEFGFRGAWSGHPEQNAVAMAQFPWPQQSFLRYPDADRAPDLAASPAGHGRVTMQGTRDACRTMIRYAAGYLEGRGASLIEGRMEDLATYRIYVMMLAQRIRHRVGADDGGERHSRALVQRIFQAELDALRRSADAGAAPADLYAEARAAAEDKVGEALDDPLADFRFAAAA